MEEKIELYEEETSILSLTDENGEEVEFEYLDCIEFQGKEYLVLIPCENDASEIVILEVEPVDEETENYLSVQDEAVLNAVYEIFKEKFQDTLDFADYYENPRFAGDFLRLQKEKFTDSFQLYHV